MITGDGESCTPPVGAGLPAMVVNDDRSLPDTPRPHIDCGEQGSHVILCAFTQGVYVMPKTIRIAAALLIGTDGQTLLVRKRGTQAFMQPGGKIDAGEQPAQALARELYEELGLEINPADAQYLGHFSAPAANEPGFTVAAELFEVRIDVPVTPAAEIEEVRWIDPAGDGGLQLAPLTRDLILPFYRSSLTTTA